MKMELIIRRFAGTFILARLVLAHYHSPYWLWVTAFVGFNLLQSSFTKFCPPPGLNPRRDHPAVQGGAAGLEQGFAHAGVQGARIRLGSGPPVGPGTP